MHDRRGVVGKDHPIGEDAARIVADGVLLDQRVIRAVDKNGVKAVGKEIIAADDGIGSRAHQLDAFLRVMMERVLLDADVVPLNIDSLRVGGSAYR